MTAPASLFLKGRDRDQSDQNPAQPAHPSSQKAIGQNPLADRVKEVDQAVQLLRRIMLCDTAAFRGELRRAIDFEFGRQWLSIG